MQEGEEQAQIGEHPEDDDAWTRLSGAGREGLGQRLARGIATTSNISATQDTEHTKLVQPAEFPGTISLFASDKDEAAKQGKWYTDNRAEQCF